MFEKHSGLHVIFTYFVLRNFVYLAENKKKIGVLTTQVLNENKNRQIRSQVKQIYGFPMLFAAK